jgi:anti-anti-sigma factor
MNTMSTVREQEFTAEATLRDGVLVVTLSGNADLNVKAQLDRFLAGVHAEAELRGVTDVEVDVRNLEFMNSSCLKCLVGWISRIQEEPPARQYRISFQSSPALFWQRRSLHALSCLASELVSVHT